MARTKTRTRRSLPAVRTTTTAVARRAPRANPLTKANERLTAQLKSTRGKLRATKAEMESQTVTTAAVNGGLVLAGAGALGALKGLTGKDYIAGVAIEAPAGLATAAAGIYLQRPELIYAAAGMLAPLVAEMADEMLDGMKSGEGLQAPGALLEAQAEAAQVPAQSAATANG